MQRVVCLLHDHALDQLQLNVDKATAPQQHAEAFTFGDPTPVMDKRDILNYASASITGAGLSRRSALTGWLRACARPCITARRFT